MTPLSGVIYLTAETILEIHKNEMIYTKGELGLRNQSGFLSAVEQPRATYGGEELYKGIFLKAAVLAHGISEGQVFIDGNKRAGLLSALVFLEINGLSLAKEVPELEDCMMNMANKSLSKEGFAEKLKGFFKTTD